MFNKTVLVVERNPKEAKSIVDALRSHGFRNKADVVHSKAEAMEYVFHTGAYGGRDNHETPGLILLDLQTNKTEDVKTLKPLQWYIRTQSIPIIILISSAEQEKEVRLFNLGVVGYMRKPFDFTHFIEAIQQLGMKWQEQSR